MYIICWSRELKPLTHQTILVSDTDVSVSGFSWLKPLLWLVHYIQVIASLECPLPYILCFT
jgi:hypothetical protein